MVVQQVRLLNRQIIWVAEQQSVLHRYELEDFALKQHLSFTFHSYIALLFRFYLLLLVIEGCFLFN